MQISKMPDIFTNKREDSVVSHTQFWLKLNTFWMFHLRMKLENRADYVKFATIFVNL